MTIPDSVNEMIRGLVRCAEFKEQDEGGKIWDHDCRRALEEARRLGWGKHQIGRLDGASAIGDQPPPQVNGERPIWERVIEMCERWAGHPTDARVIEDMRHRDRLGRKRYGTPLQPKNGRNQLVDAYQEILDLIAYLANEIVEQGGELDSMDTPLNDMLWRQISYAATLREMIDNRETDENVAAAAGSVSP